MCKDFALSLGDIVEFSGTDEFPKQQLLLSIIALSILPKSLSGCELDVIYICTNHKFRIIGLIEIIEKLTIHTSINRPLLDSILDRFRLYDASSISDCCMVLKSLLLFPRRYGKIGLVIIDDIGIFSWESKMCTNKELRVKECIDFVKTLTQEYKILMIFSQFLPLVNDGHPIKPWLKIVNYRFKLESYFEGTLKNTQIQQLFPDKGISYKFIPPWSS